MKNDTTTTLLNFVLAALVILSVVFAYLAIMNTRELRSLSVNAANANNNIMRVNSLLNDVMAYNSTAKSPELNKAIALLQPKSVTK
ncbi:MAG: hypothetical protein RL616_795 [Verrucomicrobiota bacterium]|jgi:uncharacterized protein (UPF0333 family)